MGCLLVLIPGDVRLEHRRAGIGVSRVPIACFLIEDLLASLEALFPFASHFLVLAVTIELERTHVVAKTRSQAVQYSRFAIRVFDWHHELNAFV